MIIVILPPIHYHNGIISVLSRLKATSCSAAYLSGIQRNVSQLASLSLILGSKRMEGSMSSESCCHLSPVNDKLMLLVPLAGAFSKTVL